MMSRGCVTGVCKKHFFIISRQGKKLLYYYYWYLKGYKHYTLVRKINSRPTSCLDSGPGQIYTSDLQKQDLSLLESSHSTRNPFLESAVFFQTQLNSHEPTLSDVEPVAENPE